MATRGELLEEIIQAKSSAMKAIEQLGGVVSTLNGLQTFVQATMPEVSPAIFSQRDPRWEKVPLGASKDTTIGSHGCLLTCVASMLVDAGVDTDPAKMNQWLVANSGFSQGNLFVFAAIDSLSPLKFAGIVDTPKPQDTPLEKIRSVLSRRGGVIAKVDFSTAAGVQEHWIRVLSLSDDGKQAAILDPWPLQWEGNIVNLCPRFGKDVATALWRVAFYEIVGGI